MKEKKKDFFEFVTQNLGKLLFWSVISLLVIPFLLVLIIKLVSLVPYDVLALSGNKEIWFAFYGSYFGCFLTLLLTYFTLKLTVKIQERSEAELIREHAFSVATNMPNFSNIKGNIFYIEEVQPLRVARYFESSKDYIFAINMTPAFPPYFKICIHKIEFEWNDLSEKNRGKKMFAIQEIADNSYHIVNNDNTQLIFQIDVERDQSLATILKQFYYYKHMTTEYTMQRYETLKVFIHMSCRNVLIGGDSRGDVQFCYNIDMKNVGLDANKEGMDIIAENRMMQYQQM